MTDKLRPWGAIITTILIFLLLAFWIFIVAKHLGDLPQLDDKGNVIIDEFQRTKDILLVVLPLATTAVGYWLGSQGTTQAQEQASKATESANKANDSANKAADSALALAEAAKRAHDQAAQATSTADKASDTALALAEVAHSSQAELERIRLSGGSSGTPPTNVQQNH